MQLKLGVIAFIKNKYHRDWHILMFDAHIPRLSSIIDKRIINYMRNYLAFMTQMFLKSNHMQTLKINIIRYGHDNIDKNDDDINGNNIKQVMRDTNISRTLIWTFRIIKESDQLIDEIDIKVENILIINLTKIYTEI